MSPRADSIWVRCAAAWGLALVLSAAAAQSPDGDWIDATLIDGGEIQVDFGGDDRFHGLVRAAAVIDAPVDKVWQILVDCESAPSYLDNVRSCELVETLDGGRAQIFRQRAKLRWFLPAVEHEFRMDYEPYERIDVSRVSGPFERLSGEWRLQTDERGRTRVDYRLELEPGPLIPDFLLTAPLRRDIVNALLMVRTRAQADQPSD